MNSIKRNNLEQGERNEKIMIPIFNTFFNGNFVKDKNQFATLDFTDSTKKMIIELKSRNIKSTDFPSIMISKHKYDAMLPMLRLGYRCFFFWKLKDKIVFYEAFDYLEDYITYGKCTITRRGKWECSDVMYIPMNKLHDINDYRDIDDYTKMFYS